MYVGTLHSGHLSNRPPGKLNDLRVQYVHTNFCLEQISEMGGCRVKDVQYVHKKISFRTGMKLHGTEGNN
jgi:hypothetical protein